MLVISFTLVLFIQTKCEWVQISQQHYKKPLRPAHEHPLLATVMKTSEPTHSKPPRTVETTSYSSRPTEEHALSPIVKVIDSERTTKRNRIYINHTLQNNRWDTDIGLEDFDQQHEFVIRKPPIHDEMIVDKTKSKGDVLVIRRPKPDKIENIAKADKPLGHRTPKPSGHRTAIPGNVLRVQPGNNKGSHKTQKPLEEYKGPIEVLNMADLEYTTAEDTSDIKRKQVTESSATPKTSDKKKKESQKNNEQRNQPKPHHETNIKSSTVLKGISNLRRVDILRSTKPTLIEEYDNIELENFSTSSKPEFIIDKSTKTRGGGGTEVSSYKFPNIGHVNRVRKANTTRSTRKPKPHTKFTTPKSVFEEDNSTEQSQETVNNIRRVDKPTRRDTTEKNFPLKTKPMLKNNVQSTKIPDPDDAMLEELITEDENQPDIKVHKVTNIGTIKRVANPTKSPEVSKDKLDRHNVIKPSATLSPEENFDEDVTVEDDYPDHDFNDQYKNEDYAISNKEIPIRTTVKPTPKKTTGTRRPEIVPQIERYGLNPNNARPSNIPGYVKKENNFDYDEEFDTTTENSRKTNKNNVKTDSVNQHNTKRKDAHSKSNIAKDSKTQKETDESEEESLSNDKKSNAMENLIKFLKTVTEIIARNTRRGVHGKLRYLEDLRDTLMANIEERIEAAFPDDPPGPSSSGSRRERSAEPRGHVEFPSSEGALMTISFLTFAVFLIKLVLQVIQAYKNKTMMMMPTVVAAVGRAYTEGRRANN